VQHLIIEQLLYLIWGLKMAITSKEINLAQLDNELGGQGLIANFMDLKNKIIKPADNSTLTEQELEAGIAAHIAIDEVAIKAQAKAAAESKLAALGLTTDDLRALGL
jgi:hypothetical protein